MGLMQRVGLAVIGALTAGWLTVSAQVPQPFPGRQNPPRPPRLRRRPLHRSPPTPAPDPRRPRPAEGAPTEATLGFPVYPSSQFIASYDAGRGQRYYLFGSDLPFAALVKYYQSALKNKGTLVFDAPATHVFEIGRFREETMAFPPGVTVKDYTWNGSAGYMNPKRNATARAVSVDHSDCSRRRRAALAAVHQFHLNFNDSFRSPYAGGSCHRFSFARPRADKHVYGRRPCAADKESRRHPP